MVLTTHPVTILSAVLSLAEEFHVDPRWLYISLKSSVVLLAFSFNALVVMSFDRYLATSYPIVHRTSVTKRRVSTLLVILNTVSVILFFLSFKDFVISYAVAILIGFNIDFPPMLVLNYKLLKITRTRRRNKKIAPDEATGIKKSFSAKNISSCLLAVTCFVVLSTPIFAYIVLRKTSNEKKFALNATHLTGLWAVTVSAMNSTFNCLIFYWKNKILRTEGMRVIKSIKACLKRQ